MSYNSNNSVLQAAHDVSSYRFTRNISILGVIALFALVCLIRCPVEVDAGSRYVVTSFGKTTGAVLEPGLHFIAPWQSGVRLSVLLAEVKETMKVPTSGGLMVSMDSSSWVALDPSPLSLVKFVNEIGAANYETIVASAKRNVLRDTVASYTYEQLYSSNRVEIGAKVLDNIRAVLGPKGITVDRVLLRDLTPPDSVLAAQERKVAAQQAAETMQYVIAKETQGIEQKKKEAEGIAGANREIANSLSPEYLQWYYVKAIEGLAHSTNTTFVIVPFDQKLVPMLNLNK